MSFRPPPPERVMLSGPAGLLEAVVEEPENYPGRRCAIVCHPHPLHGGSKDHPFLWAVRADLANRGFAVVSFNFRGVMGSEGSHGAGVGEVADARAAIGFAVAHAPGALLLFGWSFGANVALREAMDDERVGAVALAGTPLATDRLADLPPLPSAAALGAYPSPVLLVSGDRDPFSPAGEVRILARKLAAAKVEIVPGADHFFARMERQAAGILGAFAESALPETSG